MTKLRKVLGRSNVSPKVEILYLLVLVLGVAWLFVPEASYAQGTAATIQGTVTDSTGAVIPKATITARNIETGLQRTVESNERGFYAISNLPAGRYQTETTTPGFQTHVRENVALSVGQQMTLNVTLEVGTVAERVTVTGEAFELLTTTSEVSSVVTPTAVKELPLLTRDFRDLVTLVPGVVPMPRSYTQGGVFGNTRSFRLSVGGGRVTQTGFFLDGLYINQTDGYPPQGVSGGQLGIDMVREFRILINSYSAEFGRSSAGVINMISNSGTNSFHGTVFEYLRNDKLNARNFFDIPDKAPMRRNQFGFSFGGPIQRDKTFFFLTWEGFRGRIGRTQLVRVPDLNARAGSLPDAQGKPTPVPNPIPSNLLRAVMDLYPLPSPAGKNFGDGSQEAFVPTVLRDRDDIATLRLDRVLSSNHNLFARYTVNDGLSGVPRPSAMWEQITRSRTLYVSIQEDWIVTPQAVNTFRVGMTRRTGMGGDIALPGTRIDPAIVIPQRWDPPYILVSPLTDTGQLGSSRFNRGLTENVFQYSDDLTYIRGNHTLKFGGRADWLQRNPGIPEWSMDGKASGSGRWNFASLRNLIQGQVTDLRDSLGGIGQQGGQRQTLFGGYIQDDFRVRENLTLNLGLRLEYNTSPNLVGWPIYSLANLNSSSTYSKVDYSYKNSATIGPRVGLAWTPLKRDESFAVRAGVGIFYDQLNRGFWRASLNELNAPYSGGQSILRGVSFPYPYSQGYPSSTVARPQWWQFERSYKVPTSYQYNLSLAKTLFNRLQVTAAYAGSQARHLVGSKAVNTYPRSEVNGRAFYNKKGPLRNPNYPVDIILFTTEGNSYYHSFQLNTNLRLAEGTHLQGAYTFAKCIDLVSADNTSDFGGLREKYYYDAYNLRNERGLCSMDVRQRLAFNMTYDLHFQNLQGIGKILLDGWALSGVMQIQNGAPFSGKSNFLRSNSKLSATAGNPNFERPDLAPGFDTSKIVLGGREQYFNPKAFVLQPEGFIGNAGRNIIPGPGLVTVDLSVSRTIPLRGERLQLQFRGEFFNLFNKVNWGLPQTYVFTNATGVHNAGAGRISNTSTDSRQIQLALKLIF